ncbi:MAG: hypothetical protein IJ261_06445, partial [Clostridia bacterium]|nr:hypothetical protein [Clostridia bacterium]
MSKKIISLLLVLVIMACCTTAAFATDNTVKLYNVYGDGMLFAQNKDAILAGEGTPGSTVKVQLFNENSLPIRTGWTKVEQDGTFAVSFSAPAGGYKEYSIVLTQDSYQFATLENIVFGELWLASGQSNMMYPLIQTQTGLDMLEKGQELNKWLRVFMEPAYPTYNGTNAIPVDPQCNIEGAAWTLGDNPNIYSMSAVAYFFAEEMMAELDMPIGILN